MLSNTDAEICRFAIEPHIKKRILRNKIGTFVTATDCTKTVQLVMVTTYGLKDSKYYSIVNAQILLDDLFKE